jgi:hypothetical protein
MNDTIRATQAQRDECYPPKLHGYATTHFYRTKVNQNVIISLPLSDYTFAAVLASWDLGFSPTDPHLFRSSGKQ